MSGSQSHETESEVALQEKDDAGPLVVVSNPDSAVQPPFFVAESFQDSLMRTTCVGGDVSSSQSSHRSCLRTASPLQYCKILLFGQALSLLLAISGAAQATLHFDCNLSAPTFSSGIFYFLLSLHLIPLYRRGLKSRRNNSFDGIVGVATNTAPRHWFLGIFPLQVHPLAYLGIALIDVEANYFTVLAFRYTTLTSVTLFDALAIPSAMTLSFLFLKRRYHKIHFLGVFVCFLGIGCNVFADYEADHKKPDEEYPHKLLGDMLAICGGIMYGANDVLAELSVRRFGGPVEFLGMLGMFATLISIIQAAILERDDIATFFRGIEETADSDDSVCSVEKGLALLFLYAGVCTLSYMGASRFLLVSEAAFFSLSLLTGDLWSVTFSVVAERIVPDPLFFVALAMTVSGVCIYEMGPSSVLEGSDDRRRLRREKDATDGLQLTRLQETSSILS